MNVGLDLDNVLADVATTACVYLKQEHGIDTVFPLKKKMETYDEALRLAQYSDEPWVELPAEEDALPERTTARPEYIERRERSRQETLKARREAEGGPQEKTNRKVKTLAKMVPELRIWEGCDVPLQAAVIRDCYEGGAEMAWILASTLEVEDPLVLRRYYRLRPTVEERIRQAKCFWDMSRFKSTRYSLVVNQVVFVLLAYTLVQTFLWKTGRKELARLTRQRLFEEFDAQEDEVALYCDGHVAFLAPLDYQELLLTLDEAARRKLLGRTRDLRAERTRPPEKPWRP